MYGSSSSAAVIIIIIDCIVVGAFTPCDTAN
jgi:hypothetical protein